MAYYADQVDELIARREGQFIVVRAVSAATCVQCYLSGERVASRHPDPATRRVEFLLGAVDPLDVIFLLAVDAADGETDYFAEAFPEAAAHGNRLLIGTPVEQGYAPGDLWRVHRGDAGDVEADELICEREIHPGGRQAGGWGSDWGRSWGYGVFGPGWGYGWGYRWGFGATFLEHKTEPLPPGDYPVKVTVADAAGNESTADEDTVTLDTYPRPVEDLAVVSFDDEADELTLSFTESPDT